MATTAKCGSTQRKSKCSCENWRGIGFSGIQATCGKQVPCPRDLRRRQFNFLPCRVHCDDRERTHLTFAV